MALVLVTDTELKNPLPGTPVVTFPPKVITSDRFLRTGNIAGSNTDTVLGGGGAIWQASGSAAAGYVAQNGFAQASGAGTSALWLSGIPNDVEVSLQLQSLHSSQFLYLFLRGDPSTSNYGYQLRITAADTSPGLMRVIRNNATEVTGAVEFLPTSKIGIRAKGSTISILKDDVIALSVNDAAITSGVSVGLRTVAGFNGSGLKFTDFVVKTA